MSRVIALRSFSYAPDGMRAQWVEEGTRFEVSGRILADLVALGNVDLADLAIPRPAAVRKPPTKD